MIRCNLLNCYFNDSSGYCDDAIIEDGYCTIKSLDESRCPECGTKLEVKTINNGLEHFGRPVKEEALVCPFGCDND